MTEPPEGTVAHEALLDQSDAEYTRLAGRLALRTALKQDIDRAQGNDKPKKPKGGKK